MRFGNMVVRFRWVILPAWLAVAAALWLGTPKIDRAENERQSFLPKDTAYRRATDLLGENFPRRAGLSQVVIVFERPDGELTGQDKEFVQRFAGQIDRHRPGGPTQAALDSVAVLTPGQIDAALAAILTVDAVRNTMELLPRMVPSLRGSTSKPAMDQTVLPANPMRGEVNAHGQATVVRVNIPVDFITYKSKKIVEHIREMLLATMSEDGLTLVSPGGRLTDETLHAPAGMNIAVSGSGGYGRDYAVFVEQGHAHTMYATLIAVILILLLVYRAPIAAGIPLLAISIAAVIVLHLMQIAQGLGLAIGMAERIFVFVLMYGAGVDYTLLLISRYREHLGGVAPPKQAVADGLNGCVGALIASAATDSIGILMLIFCSFLIFQTTGPIVAGALVVALLASITLAPALLAIFGRGVFWPGWFTKRTPKHASDAGMWGRVGRFVTRHPALVLAATLAVLAIPAWQAPKIQWVYDALAGMDRVQDAPKNPDQPDRQLGNAAVGKDVAKRHWPSGELAPTTILIELPTPPRNLDSWRTLSTHVQAALDSIDGVQNVRTLSQPLGRGVTFDEDSKAQTIFMDYSAKEYLGRSGRVLRAEVILAMHTMSQPAMELVGQLDDIVAQAARDAGFPDAEIHVAGATAQMLSIREVTQADFRLVLILVPAVILGIVLLLLRDVPLSLFMVGAILLSYAATLGLCHWIFPLLFGQQGMDWKVEIFLFVVMAAVGVDYNIFLAARLAQEARRYPARQAVARAVLHTGPVISSCGLIMAATLGSLMLGRVELLRQLGFALALGMLVDTFVVRPMLLPSFAALLGRTGRAGDWLA